MLKYAFMTFSTPELSLADCLETASRLGYDGIEPRLDSNHAHGIEAAATAVERNNIRRLMVELTGARNVVHDRLSRNLELYHRLGLAPAAGTPTR